MAKNSANKSRKESAPEPTANRRQGALIVGFLRQCADIDRHYLSQDGEKYVIYFRPKTDQDLQYACFIAEASNNPLQIGVDEKGYYYTLIIHHNYDILLHYLGGNS